MITVFGVDKEFIKIITPYNGWTTDRIVSITGETNVNADAVTVFYNSIPLRLPISNGTFGRQFVASPGLNNIYAEVITESGITLSHKVSFFSNAQPKALKIIMMWDTSQTDVDLHVIEPTGEECYYGKRTTSIGGNLDIDITDGYGPEIYTLAAPTKGVYNIKAHYYSDNGNPQSLLKVYVVMYEGTPNEIIKEFEVALTSTGMSVNVDSVTLE